MGTSTAVRSARRSPPDRRKVMPRLKAQVEALLAPVCAACAGEVGQGAVRSRSTVFCSVECALAAQVPGVYLG